MVRKTKRQPRLLIAVICLAVVVLATSAGLFFIAHHRAKNNNPQVQTKVLIAEVGKLIKLPTNEQPTVATVSNQAAVSKQTFFADAKNGDKVLLYSKNKLAVLYRPSENKIINAGAINGTLSYTPFSVTIRNGTASPQLTSDVDKQINASFPNAKVAGEAAASRNDFPSTIVIAINTADYALAGQVASAIGGQVGILPTGEAKPNSDLLIIIGHDYSN